MSCVPRAGAGYRGPLDAGAQLSGADRLSPNGSLVSRPADGAAATHSVRFFRLTHDDAGLGADEIATGLRQVRMLNDGHDTFEPIHRDLIQRSSV